MPECPGYMLFLETIPRYMWLDMLWWALKKRQHSDCRYKEPPCRWWLNLSTAVNPAQHTKAAHLGSTWCCINVTFPPSEGTHDYLAIYIFFSYFLPYSTCAFLTETRKEPGSSSSQCRTVSPEFQNEITQSQTSKLTSISQTFVINLQVWKKTFRDILVTSLGHLEIIWVHYRMPTCPLRKTMFKCQMRKGRKRGCLWFIILTHDIGKKVRSRQMASQILPSSTAVKG